MSTIADAQPLACNVSDLIRLAESQPLRWHVPDVLLEDALHVLHGDEETFKTMLTLQLLECLQLGGTFLNRPVCGGLRTGIAQLETKPRIFGHRLRKFFSSEPIPDIRVLPDDKRRKLLASRSAADRIKIIEDWASLEGLQVVSIDSAAKLLPPGCDPARQDYASDVFSQLQKLSTVWLLAHDRKGEQGLAKQIGNQETVGSGRFAQDPDVIHQMVRPDARAPVTEFHWGKVRDGEKAAPLSLFFDKADFRLYPNHPFLHLLQRGPILREQLLEEAERRYGWRERRASDYLSTLSELKDSEGRSMVSESNQGHKRTFTLAVAPQYTPRELVQPCTKPKGVLGPVAELAAAQ